MLHLLPNQQNEIENVYTPKSSTNKNTMFGAGAARAETLDKYVARRNIIRTFAGTMYRQGEDGGDGNTMCCE